MKYLNEVSLIGNLGADPEIRQLANGGKVAGFSVATTESWKDKDTGEAKEQTEWHRVNVWGDKLVDVLEKYLKKGHRVFIRGKLQTKKWQDKDGNDRWSTDVVVTGYKSQVILLERADSKNKQLEKAAADEMALNASKYAIDDEIPF